MIQRMSYNHNGIRPKSNDRIITRKSPNRQKLNNTRLNKPYVKEKVSREIREYFEMNKIQDIKIWRVQLKYFFKGTFTALNVHITKEESFPINNIIYNLEKRRVK